MPSIRQRVRRKASQRGFTLIELMIVLTIIALAAVLVVPNMARAFADVELRMQARATANLFLQARERAVYHARTYLVVFGPEADGHRALYLADEDGKVVNKVTFPASVRMRGQLGEDDWTQSPPPVHFFPNGTSQPLQLDLQGWNGSHVQLRLDPLTGRMRVAQIYKGK